MGKCYTLSFDSTNFLSGTNNNKRTYYVDWTFLPIGKRFKVTFSYMSLSDTDNLGSTYVMTLNLNLGQTSNFASSTGMQMTQYVGNLKLAVPVGSTLGYYYADVNSNPPIYLEQRPAQNNFEVQLHVGLSGVNYNTPVPADYVLTLSFEEADDY